MFHVWGNRHNLILYIEYGLEASFDRYNNIRSIYVSFMLLSSTKLFAIFTREYAEVETLCDELECLSGCPYHIR